MSTTLRCRARLSRLIAVLAVGAVLGSTPLPAAADEVTAPATTGVSSGGTTAESPVPDTTDPVPPERTDPAPPASETPSAEPAEPDPVEEQPGSTPPPTSAPTTPLPTTGPGTAEAEVTVTAALQDPDRRYRVGDAVPIVITVTNVGDATATKVQGNSTGDVQVTGDWGALGWPGLTLAPGESRTVTVTGTVFRGSGEEARSHISIWWWPEGMPVPEVPWPIPPTYVTWVNLSVPMVPLRERYPVSGVLFGDRDGDDAFDPGEGLAGVTMSLYVPVTTGDYSAELTTDQEGRFSGELPPGVYRVRTTVGPDGWIVRVPPIVVGRAEPTTDLRLQAERPLTEVLDASAEFLSDRYALSDTPRIRITLTNRGSTTLTGIKATCGRNGQGGFNLGGTDNPAHWGDLAGDGVTVAAGQTLVLEVTGTISVSAALNGLVILECSFGPDQDDLTGYPKVSTSALVLQNENIVTWGYVYHDRNGDDRRDPGEEVANLKLGLVDQVSGVVVATAVSDASGVVAFADVPAGRYWARAFGPWRLVRSQVEITVPGFGGGWEIKVVPAPEQPGPEPEQPEPAPGGTPGTPQGGLAFTGADVLGLSALGLVLVTGGSLAALVGRRRRHAA